MLQKGGGILSYVQKKNENGELLFAHNLDSPTCITGFKNAKVTEPYYLLKTYVDVVDNFK